MAIKYSIVCIYNNLFIHSSIGGHLDYFILAIMTNATMNIHVQYSFLCGHVFSILWNIFLGTELLGLMGFPGSSDGKESACIVGDPGLIPGSGRSLEKELATHSSILVWKIPRTEEPGEVQSMELQRVGHN